MCHEIPPSALRGQLVLVAEDEPLIAVDTEESLSEMGVQVIAAPSVEAALNAVRRSEISAAVLDISLRDGDVGPVCRTLNASAIPYIVTTGAMPVQGGPWEKAEVLLKPFDSGALVSALGRSFVREECRTEPDEQDDLSLLREVSLMERRILRQYRRLAILRRSGSQDSGPLEILDVLEEKLSHLRAIARARWRGLN